MTRINPILTHLSSYSYFISCVVRAKDPEPFQLGVEKVGSIIPCGEEMFCRYGRVPRLSHVTGLYEFLKTCTFPPIYYTHYSVCVYTTIEAVKPHRNREVRWPVVLFSAES